MGLLVADDLRRLGPLISSLSRSKLAPGRLRSPSWPRLPPPASAPREKPKEPRRREPRDSNQG